MNDSSPRQWIKPDTSLPTAIVVIVVALPLYLIALLFSFLTNGLPCWVKNDTITSDDHVTRRMSQEILKQLSEDIGNLRSLSIGEEGLGLLQVTSV